MAQLLALGLGLAEVARRLGLAEVARWLRLAEVAARWLRLAKVAARWLRLAQLAACRFGIDRTQLPALGLGLAEVPARRLRLAEAAALVDRAQVGLTRWRINLAKLMGAIWLWLAEAAALGDVAEFRTVGLVGAQRTALSGERAECRASLVCGGRWNARRRVGALKAALGEGFRG